ncbi:MAG TPA: CAP domain-containing protein [Conexibacter sp.]|nr:CAP domain-containing protein [Conexibacter sp.]
MTASQPLPGTTSSSPIRSAAAGLAAVLLAFACLLAALPAAAHAAKAHAARAEQPRVLAHAARSCAPASGLLTTRRSVLRSQRRLLCLMNRARARYGLRPLRPNRCLHRVGARHAHDMVNRRYFAHTTPNGWDPGRRARASGYAPRRARWLVGENIAWGVAGAARPRWVVRAWMHSPPHRRNILSRRFRDVGIGVARGVPVRGFRGVPLRATFSVEFGKHHGRTRCG